MKIIIGIVIVVAGIVANLSGPAHQSCMDPSSNTPIDCSLIGQ